MIWWRVVGLCIDGTDRILRVSVVSVNASPTWVGKFHAPLTSLAAAGDHFESERLLTSDDLVELGCRREILPTDMVEEGDRSHDHRRRN